MVSTISTLDFRTYQSNPGTFVRKVRHSLTTTGFFMLTNHGISTDLLRANMDLCADFFEGLTLEQKMQYCFPAEHHQRGYTPLRVETGEHAKVPDEKELWQYRRENPSFTVSEVPRLQLIVGSLFEEFDQLFRSLMRAVATGLDLDEGYFEGQIGDSMLRNIFYPSTSNPATLESEVEVVRGGNVTGMCATRHTDINFLTLLHATEPGLQLRHQGLWVPIESDFDSIVVNTGDMLWHLTGGRYKSGEHRVVCRPGLKRYSSPFFGHIRGGESLVPLPDLGKSDLTAFPYQTAGAFLTHRLEQIGLLAKT
jgi:isopenicillin N synthase-like dioxygenase